MHQVANFAKEINLNRYTQPNKRITKDQKNLAKTYNKEGYQQKEIAEKLGLSKSQVQEALNKRKKKKE